MPVLGRRPVDSAVATPVSADGSRALERVNALNVVLMTGTAALAWVAAVALFLFSSAVLGPLHYLTEISWLHDRRYFTTSRRDVLPLVALGAVDFVAHYTSLVSWDGAVVLAFGIALVFTLASDVRARV